MVITVGVGETYETWRAAISSLGGGITENTTIRQVADTAPATSDGGGLFGLNGFKLTLESDTPHGGDPTVGWKSPATDVDALVISQAFAGPGSVEVKDLHVAIGATGAPSGIRITVASFFVVDVSIHDCIVTNTEPNGYGVRVDMFEVLAWNVSLYNLAVSGWATGVYVTPVEGGNWKVENVTALNAASNAFAVSGPVAGTVAIRNCVGQGASGAFDSIADVSGYNNASVDETADDANWLAGSGNQTLITLNDEFVSQTINNADFLKLKNDGVCHDGGSAPSIAGNTEGIRGTARPHGALYSIGADEYPGSAPVGVSSGSGSGGFPSSVLAAIAAGYI